MDNTTAPATTLPAIGTTVLVAWASNHFVRVAMWGEGNTFRTHRGLRDAKPAVVSGHGFGDTIEVAWGGMTWSVPADCAKVVA